MKSIKLISSNFLTGILFIFIINNQLSAKSVNQVEQKIALASQINGYQNIADLRQKVDQYLQMQTIGYPGDVVINVGNIDKRLKFAACSDVKVSMPNGRRAWGKTSVNVACESPRWSLYVQAQVKVMANYLIASMPLAQGQSLNGQSVMFQKGDLTQLPAGIFTELSQVEGKVVSHSMMAGTVLRQEMLKLSPVIQQGQAVMLITQGQGFTISAEGKAINQAIEGQVVQVKVNNGQVVSGIARQDGRVEVMF